MIERVENPGADKVNVAKAFGRLLSERFEKDPRFYFFSPDETTSNRFTQIYDTEKRAWGLPTEDFDLPSSADGRIVELFVGKHSVLDDDGTSFERRTGDDGELRSIFLSHSLSNSATGEILQTNGRSRLAPKMAGS